MALHSETPDQITEGPDGPSVLAAEFWSRALEHRAEQSDGRYLYMLAVTPQGVSDEIAETSWTEIKADQVAEMVDDATGGRTDHLAWKMVVQMHNLQMRHWSGMATVFEKLGQAGNMQLEAVQKAITAQSEGALAKVEAERGQYDIERDQMEMEYYSRMFMQWLHHMQQAKAMNTDGGSITPPATLREAAGALVDSLTLAQITALGEILGADSTQDMVSALRSAATATGEDEATAIVQTILMKVAPHQEQLGRVFSPPLVPQNIAAYQNACLAVLGRASPLH